jgi:hypothetical protein
MRCLVKYMYRIDGRLAQYESSRDNDGYIEFDSYEDLKETIERTKGRIIVMQFIHYPHGRRVCIELNNNNGDILTQCQPGDKISVMYRLPTVENNIGPKINAKNEGQISTALTTLKASLARLEAQTIHLGVGEEQDRWCDIDATGFFPTDKGVLRELYECEAMKDFTITLQGGETLKINSFFASMMSEAFRMKLATPLGHKRPRMTYDLPHIRRDLLEKLISLLLSETFRVHPSEVEDLTFLANELRFPTAMRTGLDQEMQRVLDLDTDAMEREVEGIYQENRNESARRAWLVEPTEPFPTLYGFEDRTFRSSSELVLGHYYGDWDDDLDMYRIYIFCGINPHRNNTVYVKTIEPGNRYMYMPLFTSLNPMVSYDHVRPKTAYPKHYTTQDLSSVTGPLRLELTGRFCMLQVDIRTTYFLLMGYNNDERVYVLNAGQVNLMEVDDLFLIQPSEAHASEDELNRAWLAMSTHAPRSQTYHNRTPIPDDHEPTPGRYYGCMIEALGITHFRSSRSPLYFENIVTVLCLGKDPHSDRLYVLYSNFSRFLNTNNEFTIHARDLYLPDAEGA